MGALSPGEVGRDGFGATVCRATAIHGASSDTSIIACTQVCGERAEWGRFQNPYSAPICGDFQISPFRALPIDFYSLLVEWILSYCWYSSYIWRRRMGRGMGTNWTGLMYLVRNKEPTDFKVF